MFYLKITITETKLHFFVVEDCVELVAKQILFLKLVSTVDPRTRPTPALSRSVPLLCFFGAMSSPSFPPFFFFISLSFVRPFSPSTKLVHQHGVVSPRPT